MKLLNKDIYIFDVDGTLTEPRKRMDDAFAKKFVNWSKNKTLMISTGSDFIKTIEQLPKNVMDTFDLVFCCMGNELRKPNGDIVYRNNYVPKKELISDLERTIQKSNYKLRTGNHIEVRTGMLNFSVVGRNADKTQREQYFNWDKVHKERERIVKTLKRRYPGLIFSIGGEISIDIIPVGKDKGQCIEYIMNNYSPKKIQFYGDKTHPGGNDYGIVSKLENTNIESYAWANVEGPVSLASYLKI